MKIIFFDTETTGNQPSDRLCQLGIKERGVAEPILNELYKPPIPISFESMAVHHITEKMVVDKSAFIDSTDYARTKELFESADTISVAHNVAFDIGMLAPEGIAVAKPICTMKVARALDTSDLFPSYRLQYLRYRLGIEIEGVNAHDAWGDVVVLEAFFERLLSKMIVAEGSEEAAIAKMLDVTANPSLLRVINFGKHAGKKIADVAKEDAGYLRWLLKEKQTNPAGEEDWIYSLQYYL